MTAAIVIGGLAWILLSGYVGWLAEQKGHSNGAFFLLSLFWSPVVGWFVLQFVRDRRAPQPVTVVNPDRVERLTKLAALRGSGALSEEEFEAEKARVLSEDD